MAEAGKTLRVTPSALAAAHKELESVAEQLRAGLRRVESRVEEVAGQSWKGAASDAFGEYWRSFREPAQRVVEDAFVIAELVGESGSQYQAQEGANARAVGSVGGGAT